MAIDRERFAKDLHKAFTDVLQDKSIAAGSRHSHAVTAMVSRGFGLILDRIDELEASSEQQPFAYDGPHESGKVYDKGTFVTHDGSLWHCNHKTASRPGDGPAWTLAVKRGRDGKDVR